MVFRLGIVNYSLEAYYGDNGCLIAIPFGEQCLLVNAGEETGCCKMIIEKKVGGPLWLLGLLCL